MADPYGITQVNVPSLGELYFKLKERRLSDLYRAKADVRADRQDKRAEQQERRKQEEFDAYGDLWDTTAPAEQPNSTTAPVPLGRLSDLNSSLPAIYARGGTGSPPAAPDVAATPVAPASPAANPAVVAPGAVPPDAQPDDIVVTGRRPAETPAPKPGLHLNAEGLRNLARVNPKLAMELQRMDGAAQEASFKRIREHVDFESRIIAAVRRVPEEDRPAAYRRIRADLESRGVEGLPDQWDEELAEEKQAMGLTALQAFNTERADKRFAHDVQDDEADNARADRNTDSMMADRVARRGLVVRGQDVSSADRRRGQDISAARPRAAGRKAAAPAGTAAPRTATDPRTGRKVQWNGSAWVAVR